MLTHLGVELTDYCNLWCDNCPNEYSITPKGFINDEIMGLAIRYATPDQIFQLHGHGESLMHPEVLRYTEMVCRHEKNFYGSLSTNGLLLDKQMLDGLLDAGLKELFVSLHVPKSVDAFALAVDTIKTYDKHPVRLVGTWFHGNVVVDNYIESNNIYNHIKDYLEPKTKYFTWSGTVKGTQIEFPPEVVKRRMDTCWFIQNNICAIILWDGSVVACCYDFNRVNYLGHVRDFPNLKHTPETYELCKYCEPKMANNFQ